MKKYIVTLTPEERTELLHLLSLGKASARSLTHARILLAADSSPQGDNLTDAQIAQRLYVSIARIERVRQQFVEEGMSAALLRRSPNRQYHRRLDGEIKAHLMALVCSDPPPGYAHWPLRLLADKLVELEYVDSVSHETVRQTLKKTNSSHGLKSNGVFLPNRTRTSSITWKTS